MTSYKKLVTTIILPSEIRSRLLSSLREAGDQEIGGVLMGEQLEPGRFKVVDVTIQTQGGTVARFVRALAEALVGLRNFFRRTHHDYERFNYLGEWHSHPSFSPIPSQTDHQTMLELVEDPGVGAQFAALLIVKLNGELELVGSVTVYLADGKAQRGRLVMEGPDD